MSSRRWGGYGIGLLFRKPRIGLAAAAAGLILPVSLLTACSGQAPPKSSAASKAHVITVSAAKCGTGWEHPTAGVQTLQIHNSSSDVVEIQLINPSNGGVYAQLEGLPKGVTRAMPVDLGSGQYTFTCSGTSYGTQGGPVVKIPGQIRGMAAITPLTQTQINSITGQAQTYVATNLATLAQQTSALEADLRSGNLQAARSAWLTAHLTWERLGSAYGMFDDYDGEIDGSASGLPEGVNDPGFTGFYRLEYGLWHGQSATELTPVAAQLDLNVRSLRTAWPGLELPPEQAVGDLALRTHEVLENAVQDQLSGEDDYGSGTTLATLAAGIDATLAQLAILRPALGSRYPDTAELMTSVNDLQKLVNMADSSHGWTPASKLSAAQREHLDAAAEQTLELLSPLPVIFEQERPVP